MASKLRDCSVCLRDTKYVCIDCKIPICSNLWGKPEFNKHIEGWIPGKQVEYRYSCLRKLKFKRKFKEGKCDDKNESSNREFEAGKGENKHSSSISLLLVNFMLNFFFYRLYYYPDSISIL